MNKKVMALIATGVIVFGGMVYAKMSLEIIQAGYEGVVYNANGGLEDNTLSQGWKFISPLKKVTQYPISKETFNYSKLVDEGEALDTSIPIISSEGKSVSINVAVIASANSKNLKQLFTDYRGRSFEEVIDLAMKPILKKELSKISSDYALFDINSSKRDEISMKVTKNLQEEMEKCNIIVESVNITGVNLDPETQKTIDQLQKTMMEQKQVLATAEAQRAKANAEIAVAEAEAKKAKAQAEIKVAEARGVADARVAQAVGEAKANQMMSASLTPQLVELKKLEINASVQKDWAEAWAKGGANVPTTVMGTNGQLPIMPYQTMSIPSTK